MRKYWLFIGFLSLSIKAMNTHAEIINNNAKTKVFHELCSDYQKNLKRFCAICFSMNLRPCTKILVPHHRGNLSITEDQQKITIFDQEHKKIIQKKNLVVAITDNEIVIFDPQAWQESHISLDDTLTRNQKLPKEEFKKRVQEVRKK